MKTGGCVIVCGWLLVACAPEARSPEPQPVQTAPVDASRPAAEVGRSERFDAQVIAASDAEKPADTRSVPSVDVTPREQGPDASSDDTAAPTVGQDAGAVMVDRGDPLAGMPRAAVVKAGTGRLEGTVWVSAMNQGQGALVFTRLDQFLYVLIPPSDVKTFRAAGMVSRPNGNSVDEKGRLVTCEQGARISRTLADGTIETATGGGCNDLIVRSDGNIYFTSGGMDVVRVKPDGTKQVAGRVPKVGAFGANGIALSPDERWLYVTRFTDGAITRFAVAPDGSLKLTEPAFIWDVVKPDGLTVDDAGNLYVASGPGITVFAPDGRRWGVITTRAGELALNCGFGDADRRTLYIAGENDLWSVRLRIPGRP